jgi:DNA polymerase I-like protein with 3'-5' exonuclease and polymerase domains
MHSKKAATTANISIEEAEIMIKSMKEVIPVTFEKMLLHEEEALANGYIIINEVTGTRRWFKPVIDLFEERPELKTIVNKIDRAKAVYEALKKKRFMSAINVSSKARNTPIQGSQADGLHYTLLKNYEWIKKHDLDIKLINTVHDEFHYEFPDWYESFIPELLTEQIGKNGSVYLNPELIKMESDYKVADYWIK